MVNDIKKKKVNDILFYVICLKVNFFFFYLKIITFLSLLCIKLSIGQNLLDDTKCRLHSPERSQNVREQLHKSPFLNYIPTLPLSFLTFCYFTL